MKQKTKKKERKITKPKGVEIKKVKYTDTKQPEQSWGKKLSWKTTLANFKIYYKAMDLKIWWH